MDYKSFELYDKKNQLIDYEIIKNNEEAEKSD